MHVPFGYQTWQWTLHTRICSGVPLKREHIPRKFLNWFVFHWTTKTIFNKFALYQQITSFVSHSFSVRRFQPAMF